MGKTIRYENENAKHMPRVFVLETFDAKAGLWNIKKTGRRSQARMEKILANMRTDGHTARLLQG